MNNSTSKKTPKTKNKIEYFLIAVAITLKAFGHNERIVKIDIVTALFCICWMMQNLVHISDTHLYMSTFIPRSFQLDLGFYDYFVLLFLSIPLYCILYVFYGVTFCKALWDICL